jgi:hypothetical protein
MVSFKILKLLAKILQGMMTVGFSNDTKNKTAKINEKVFKILKMEIKEESSIEDINI